MKESNDCVHKVVDFISSIKYRCKSAHREQGADNAEELLGIVAVRYAYMQRLLQNTHQLMEKKGCRTGAATLHRATVKRRQFIGRQLTRATDNRVPFHRATLHRASRRPGVQHRN